MVLSRKVEKTHTSTFNGSSSSELISLRTVPVRIKANGKKVKVRAVPCDASTGTFLNEEIADALGLQSDYEKVTVRVLNEIVESFDTMPVETTPESDDVQTSMALNVRTCPRHVTGAIRWSTGICTKRSGRTWRRSNLQSLRKIQL